MLGAITGDVIGSFYENNKVKTTDFPLLRDISRITDDTVMTCAVADALISEKIDGSDFASFMKLWGKRYPNAGYGGYFKRWLGSPHPQPYNSWGNGSAMRVSAIGWAAATEEECLLLAEASAVCTHNHPEGIKGAQAVALAVFLARQGSNKEEIRQKISEHFGYNLERTIEDIRPEYDFEISCQASVPESILAFLDAENFEQAIRNAISLGGDADTQAAIAGAIAEAFWGSVPPKFRAMVIPRLPGDILDIIDRFSAAAMNGHYAAEIDREKTMRSLEQRPDGLYNMRRRYQILMDSSAHKDLAEMNNRCNGKSYIPGTYLQKELDELPVLKPNPEWFLYSLLNSKRPCIFAESEVHGDGSDWTREELKLLGKISITAPVTVFDDGNHFTPKLYEKPFRANLIFTPGILLRNDRGFDAADADVVVNGEIDQGRYTDLLEQKILPGLKYANATAFRAQTRAVVTLPGLGCGQFAGRFHGSIHRIFAEALRRILERNHRVLWNIALVRYDSYRELKDEEKSYGNLTFRIRPLKKSAFPRPQLCPPEEYQEKNDNYAGCQLYNFVAWDHVSWPGNDFYRGSRSTDDGVKAAATDTLFVLTGVRGTYDPESSTYRTPEGYRFWEDVVRESDMKIRTYDNVLLTGSPGLEDETEEEL